MTRKLKLLVREREGEHGMTLKEQIGQFRENYHVHQDDHL